MTAAKSQRKILSLLNMQITSAEQKLSYLQGQQHECRHKARAVMAAAKGQQPAIYDIPALQAAEEWRTLARAKAADFEAQAQALQPNIDLARNELRAFMGKKISIAAYIQKADIAQQRAEEQTANDTLLDLVNLRRRFSLD